MPVLYPRVWLSLNGEMIPCIHGHVTKKAKRAADTFSAELSIGETSRYGMDLAAWADYQPTDVEIYMSTAFGQADQTSMVLGEIDTPKIDWDRMIVSVSGRDKTSKLIETRRSQKFPNQKSSDIVSTIAQANGLNPVVSSTEDMAGKTYKDDDTAHLAIHRTDFEILSDLADREGFRWYVNARDLVFEPKGSASGVLQVYWSPPGATAAYGVSNVENFKAWRNMTAAKPHNVNVKSFHDKDLKQYNGSAMAPGVGEAINVDHHYHRKNQGQVDKLAMSRAMDAIRHDCNVSFSAPMDLSVTAQMQTQVNGTTTIYDQPYDIDQVDFDVAWGGGGDMAIQAKGAKNGRSVSSGGSSSGADSAAGDDGDG